MNQLQILINDLQNPFPLDSRNYRLLSKSKKKCLSQIFVEYIDQMMMIDKDTSKMVIDDFF